MSFRKVCGRTQQEQQIATLSDLEMHLRSHQKTTAGELRDVTGARLIQAFPTLPNAQNRLQDRCSSSSNRPEL